MFKSSLVCMFCALLISGAWMYYLKVDEHKSHSADQLRNQRVQHQHAELRSKRLRDSSDSQLLDRIGEDVSVVQIRLAEYLSGVATNSADHSLIYEQALLDKPIAINRSENSMGTASMLVKILRLDVQLQVPHAGIFIQLLQDIHAQIGGWPVEVRACDIQKIPADVLHARCVMDIYHWSAEADASAQ